jgi:nucleoside-diphosphate-sugar epimerase
MEAPLLVMGALGNVGAEVIKRLQAAGRKIRAADIDEKHQGEIWRFGGIHPLRFFCTRNLCKDV